MLTKTDLQEIRKVIREEVEVEIKDVKQDLRSEITSSRREIQIDIRSLNDRIKNSEIVLNNIQKGHQIYH